MGKSELEDAERKVEGENIGNTAGKWLYKLTKPSGIIDFNDIAIASLPVVPGSESYLSCHRKVENASPVQNQSCTKPVSKPFRIMEMTCDPKSLSTTCKKSPGIHKIYILPI